MDKYLEDWANSLRDGKCTMKEYNAYLAGQKELEEKISKLENILNEVSEIANLQRWYNFDSISVTQMQLRQFIRSKLNE